MPTHDCTAHDSAQRLRINPRSGEFMDQMSYNSEGNEEQRIVSVFFYNLLIVWYLCTVFFQS